MKVGLGTGSTAFFVVERVAELVAGGMSLVTVATSQATADQASASGVTLLDLDEVEALDLCIDGADEIDPAGNLIKGGGGALTREKLVALTAAELIVVADAGKLVDRLGDVFRLPVEILPFGRSHTLRRLAEFGEPTVRQKDGSDFVTDNGGNICDLTLREGLAPEAVADVDRRIRDLHGVIECGLFPGLARRIVIGNEDGSTTVREV